VEKEFWFHGWNEQTCYMMRHGLPWCGALSLEKAMILDRTPRPSSEGYDYWCDYSEMMGSFLEFLRIPISDPRGARELIRTVEAYTEIHEWGDLHPRLLIAVGRCAAAKAAGEPMEPALLEVAEAVRGETEQFDRIHQGEPAFDLKEVPDGVKAPLAWQALQVCRYGDPERVLRLFPKAVLDERPRRR